MFFVKVCVKVKNQEHLLMATSVILNTSITNAFRSSQLDLFCKIDISIDILKKFKNTCKRVHF